MRKSTISYLFLICLIFISYNSSQASTYYLTFSGRSNAQTSSNWNTNQDGTGTSATSFTNSGDIFIVPSNLTGIINGNWTIGSGVTLEIQGNLNIDKNSNSSFAIYGVIIFPSSEYALSGPNTGNSKSSFILESGATLKTANPNGILGTNCSIEVDKFTVTLNSGATYEFNGTIAQTTLGLPAQISNLVVNNSNGITLSDSVTISGAITMTSGLVSTGTKKIYFSSNASNPTETTNNRIVGTAVMASRSVGTASLNFLNAYLHAGSDVGIVTITRVTGSAVTIGSYSGINSYWNITTTNTSATRSIDYSWLSVYDNNHAFSSNNKAQIYKSTDGGSIWVNVGTPSDVSGSNPRTITITNVLPSMKWTVSSGDAPLPVQLASLTSSITGRNVSLKWSTSQEINNSGFEIERKNNGGDFVKVGFVMGKGTVSTTTNYEFTDRNLASGNYSYRLKQIDNNGNFEYFSLNGDVVIGIHTKFDLSQNYPNPFNPTTKINFDLPKDSKVSMKLYDMLGREVLTLLNEFRTAGYYTIDFNATSLSSGVYFYRISAGEFSAVKKMTLIK
jgi:hypothetical protein